MSRILASVLLFSFCLQGVHFIEDPTPIKPYMLCVPLILLWAAVNNRWISKVFVAEKVALVFFCFMIVSSLWAEEISLSILKVIGIILLMASYYATRSVVCVVPSATLFKILSIGGVLVMVTSLTYYAIGFYYFDESLLIDSFEGLERGLYGLYLEGSMVRMRGVFDSPNNLSLVCVFLFLFYDFNKTGVSTIGKILTSISLMLTLSLTGLIALAVGYFFSIFIQRRYSSLLWLSFGVVAFSAAVHFTAPERIIDPLIDVRLERLTTGSGRWDLFEYALKKIGDKPIIGYGLNQSRVILKEHREMQSTHNSFMEAAVDGGILALVLYSLSWFFYLTTAFKLSSRYRQPFYFASAISLFIFSQLNLLTFVEITILYFAIWFEIAVRGNDHILESESASQAQFRPKFAEGL